ncbi:MAG: hypothetical protein ACYDD2_06735 [Candidatus Acidiferrales bacterium]
MNVLRRIAMAIGGTVVVALVVTLAVPRAAHAVLSALVTVTNTSANPVPTYDSGTRFQTDVCFASGSVSVASNFCGLNNSRTFQVPTVTSSGATVKRLVVDNVSGICSNFNNPALFIKTVFLSGPFVPDSVPKGVSSAGHHVPIAGALYSYVNSPGAPSPFAGVPETDYSFGPEYTFFFQPRRHGFPE